MMVLYMVRFEEFRMLTVDYRFVRNEFNVTQNDTYTNVIIDTANQLSQI